MTNLWQNKRTGLQYGDDDDDNTSGSFSPSREEGGERERASESIRTLLSFFKNKITFAIKN